MRNLTIIYILALTIIGLVIGTSQYLVQSSISISRYDSRTINISGRQSMLSQKITKSALEMETAESEEAYDLAKLQLTDAAELWELSHNALQYGSNELELNDVNNSEKTLLLFLEVEPHFTAMEGAVDKISRIPFPMDSSTHADLLNSVDVLLSNDDQFLSIMNEITLDYDNESSVRVSQLSKTEYVLFGVAVLLLILEGLLIFRPAINQINEYTHKLEEHEKSLELALTETQKEKEKVDFLNLQSKSVFENVRQGLFLLDKNFTISELYSKEMDHLFDAKNLGGTNFLSLMRPRLVQRDRDALEMFVKHLFNPGIATPTLQKLNPIDKVQIFSTEKDGTLEARHVRVSFSRITGGDTIMNVLVTMTDETAAVQMEKRISDTEERNKKESAQLLSILRVDPIMLQEFLNRAKADLEGISSLYESDKLTMEFQSLITITFNTIHNLKGNASLVDLQLVADRLHEIENITSKLREKEDLRGDDFLKILFEINELTMIINNMERMLGRIAEVNQKLNCDVFEESNAKLIQALDAGFRKITKELGKSANLIIEENGTLIPKKLHLAVRDIGIQLIRNSMVHGIEEPAIRERKDKPKQGELKLTFDQGPDGQFILSFNDDGNGLDTEKIASQAIKNKLITEEMRNKMDDEAIAHLIFKDGFSTASSISHHAGRGQGMSVIASIVEKQNGTYSLTSTGSNRGFSLVLTMEANESDAHIIQKVKSKKLA